MNISSETSPTDQSNSSSYDIFNATVDSGIQNLNIGFNMYLIVCSASMLLGLPTNSYVIWLIVRGTGNGLAAEFFSLNLSVSEILFCLNSILSVLSFKVSTEIWIAVNLLQGLATTGRPLFQCMICIERYLAVVHPVTFLKFKPLRYRVICSVIVWVASVCSFAVTTIAKVLFLKYLSIGFIMAQLILFHSIQLFCCLAVLRALKQSGPGERGRERDEENHKKRKAFKIILIITVAMVFIYVPYIISMFLSMSSSAENKMYVTYAFFALAGLVLPFLFLHRVGKLPLIKCQ